jgi:hypothetical protein
MKTSSLWVIRIALTVQFVAVLAVPSLVASAESPRGMWIAEWLGPQAAPLSAIARSAGLERTIGILKLRDGKLSFVEQIAQTDWALDLVDVRRVSIVNGTPSTLLRAGRSIVIDTVTGEEFVIAILDADLVQASPKKALAVIERAAQSMLPDGR